MESEGQNIIQLMARKVLGVKLSAPEESRLTNWLEKTPANRQLFEQIKSFQDADAILKLEREGYGRRMALRVLRRLRKERKSRSGYRWLAWTSGVAATIVAVVFVMVWTWQQSAELPWAWVEPFEQITPGKVAAVLTFADGEKWHITDSTWTGGWEERLEVVDEETECYNTLSIPAGGEFFYVLSDSTKVWINSDSELRFPAHFGDDVRRVELSGEAFFEVAHDGQRPFVVTLPEGDITVYGTRFNVSDYEDADLSAVLVEGSIGFRPAQGDSVRLTPSDRMLYHGGDGEISVEKVDTELYTSWIDRRFVFRNQTLGEIMQTLSRWYDFQVSFADEAARFVRLSGRLNRYDDISVLLRTYEKVGDVHFVIKGKTIIVYYRH